MLMHQIFFGQPPLFCNKLSKTCVEAKFPLTVMAHVKASCEESGKALKDEL